ncbi:cytochrome c-type biogenesis protein CcmH [Chloroflexota bacterium]
MGLKKLGIAILLVLFSASPVMADSPTVSDISNQLICQCGCGTVLADCSHAECASREEMTALIEEKLAQGQSEEQIIQFFVAQYGEQVLASPPKRGFNLVAWILPFAAMLGGGGVIYIALKKWVRRETPSQTYATTEIDESDEKYHRQLEEELEEFMGKGFR